MRRGAAAAAHRLPALFDCLAATDLAHLRAQAVPRLLKKREVLWTDGATLEHLAIVCDGCLAATRRDDSGVGGCTVVAAFPAGAIVARSLTTPRPALMEVRALVGSTVLLIPLFALRPLAEKTPALYEAFCDAVVQALYHRLNFAHRLVTATVERRLAWVLWELSHIDHSGQRVVAVKLGQAELAQLVGTDRSELSRRQHLLVKAGMLEATRGGLRLSPAFRVLLASEPGAPGFVLDSLR